MTDAELDAKRRKAARYARQPERFSLEGISLRMQSEHGERLIRLAAGRWECTCPFYHERGVCSHIMAAQALLQALLPASSDSASLDENPD